MSMSNVLEEQFGVFSNVCNSQTFDPPADAEWDIRGSATAGFGEVFFTAPSQALALVQFYAAGAPIFGPSSHNPVDTTKVCQVPDGPLGESDLYTFRVAWCNSLGFQLSG